MATRDATNTDGGRLGARDTDAMDATTDRAEAAGRRALLLELLRASQQPLSIRSMAEDLGVHANTVRFHLDALLRTGQVEQVLGDRAGPGRPPVMFRATHRMDPTGPTNYRLLAAILTDHLATSSADPAVAATELGRAWGPHLLQSARPAESAAAGGQPAARTGRTEALARMTRLLTDLGFSPEAPTGSRDATIRLRHCPFLGLVTGVDEGIAGADVTTRAGAVRGHGGVICSLHLGLMQGAFASLHGPVTVDRLDPFVEPDLCVAHLARAATAPRPSQRRSKESWRSDH